MAVTVTCLGCPTCGRLCAGGWPTERRRLRKLEIAEQVDTDDFVHKVSGFPCFSSSLAVQTCLFVCLVAGCIVPVLSSWALWPLAAPAYRVRFPPDTTVDAVASCAKQGADAEGRTPLELIREGQVVRGTVVAQLLYHGAQVGRHFKRCHVGRWSAAQWWRSCCTAQLRSVLCYATG